MNGTIKQFKDTIEEMRAIYPFDDDKAYITTYNLRSEKNKVLRIHTTDEKTGIEIVMEKQIERI